MADPSCVLAPLPEGTKTIRVECESKGTLQSCSCIIAKACVFRTKEGLDLNATYPDPSDPQK